MTHSTAFTEKARRVRFVVTDCDGVLTDGGVYYGESGEVLKRFQIKDGMGVERLRAAGIGTGIITGELSPSVRRRAEKLGITELVLGCKTKLAEIQALAVRQGLELGQIAYIGDDMNDLEALGVVGFRGCPADAVPAVCEAVDMVCRACGGNGAFREFAETILIAQGLG